MSKNGKLCFGVVGTGSIGKIHLQQLSMIPDEVIISAVTDVFEPSAQKVAAEFNVPRVCKTYTEMLEDKDIDAVIIAVPNKYHAPIAIDALKAGKHIMLEKPMAFDVRSAKDIVRAQKEYKKIVMVPHQMRWNWLSREIKQNVEAGELGRIYYAKTGWLRRKGIPGWGSAFTRKEESGGGALIDIGVHMIDLALYLMGNPKPVSVFGSTYAELGQNKIGLGTWGTRDMSGWFDVDDLATALIRMEDGSMLSLEVSWAMHGDIGESNPWLYLFGTEGGAQMTENEGKFYTEGFDRSITVDIEKPDNTEDSRAAMLRHFIDCVREGKESISNQMTGLTNNLILDAIYQSSQTKREVILDWNL
ncbi:MAG: putative oxidoreductase YcjS [Firmicutes bacterium ADurb.Bin193]|nr:MAG: putative oxidoreductase YcjS [Firmicutes bacterium ADurb.Bin193]